MMDVAHLYLSMEIGGTNLRYGVLDETFRVLDFKKEPSRYLSDAEDKGEYIEGLVRPYIERYGKEDFLCMTLSLASLMNRERTINYNSPKGIQQHFPGGYPHGKDRAWGIHGEGCEHGPSL